MKNNIKLYFRYALISAVWNAALLDARNSHTDRLSQRFVFVCPEARAQLRLNTLFQILLYEIDVNTVSYVFRAGQNT